MFLHKSTVMKNLIQYGMMLLVCMAVSCSEVSSLEEEGYGWLSVGISDGQEDIVQMKSADEGIVYRLDIYDSEDVLKASVPDHTTVSEDNPIALLMGKYNVKATYGTEGTGFNNPAFGGENSVRVFAEKPASVDIICKMKKIKFSVSFPDDDDFRSKFSLYEVAVRAGEDILTFSSASESAEASRGSFRDTAYFEVPADKILTYTLTMRNSDGAQYSASNTIEDVASAEHYHFKFTLGEREDIDGALVLNVLLDGEYKTQFSHDILLNFDKLEMPSYSHNPEFDPVPSDGSLPVYPLGNAITKKFTFSAPRGIKSMIISHLDANLLAEGLPQVTDLAGAGTEELQVLNYLGISASAVAEGAVEAEIDITDFVKNLAISPEGEPYLMSLTVIDAHNRYARCEFEFSIVSDIQAETLSATPWSSFATLKGRFFSRTAPAGVTFQYRKTSDTEWTEIDPDLMQIDQNTLTYSYRLKGLELDTEYVFRSTSDKDKDDGKEAGEVGFKTYATENTVYNLGFDDWVKVGKAWYATANEDDVENGLTWDSANEGTADILGQSLVPTTPEETVVIKGKAARMESGELLSNFAAGNIYTGDFGSATTSPVGATLDWGIPFNSRPLALRGWYRYEPKAIDKTSSAYSYLAGQTDFCQIQIFLTTWSNPFTISTGDNRFVDTSERNSSIIAHGQIISQDNTTDNEGNVNGYVQFTIPLQYRNLNQPSYIVISGAASRYGDYFTGALGSTLYLDELELVYDPDLLTPEEFELVMGGIK